MPGILKIGMTHRDPYLRAKELTNNTAVPTPFKVVHYVLVNGCQEVEKLLHHQLTRRNCRVRSEREFFRLSKRQAIKDVRAAAKGFALRHHGKTNEWFASFSNKIALLAVAAILFIPENKIGEISVIPSDWRSYLGAVAVALLFLLPPSRRPRLQKYWRRR
ncbi:T5orf172 domain-containing protein [Thalassospira xiamenensis]|uniref:T5orf172 domain-containing protein n=2 Tax=Thalassospiraceae TaxID=2844866 RepID=A0A285TT56_9PROT|nr:T5orf172 domain-containing protein [Thalassospira xiamenensis]